tara:strand:- start:1145 stop:1672 length:528 start_codon:yes stop_codon:yes gene_type:complete
MTKVNYSSSEETFKGLCRLTTEVLGLPKDSLSLKSRSSEIQIPRSVASVVGRMVDDIHPTVIAKVINRHRCSVYHYENTHKSNYANCEKYRNIFNKIYKAHKDLEGTKDFFLDGDYMRVYLLKRGVSVIYDGDVSLEVNSGQVKCIIKTSYFDFSNQLENIKLALKNYHFTVNII